MFSCKFFHASSFWINLVFCLIIPIILILNFTVFPGFLSCLDLSKHPQSDPIVLPCLCYSKAISTRWNSYRQLEPTGSAKMQNINSDSNKTSFRSFQLRRNE